jgi:hypothetical protein
MISTRDPWGRHGLFVLGVARDHKNRRTYGIEGAANVTDETPLLIDDRYTEDDMTRRTNDAVNRMMREDREADKAKGAEWLEFLKEYGDTATSDS